MEIKKIYLDMDGVLADFDRGVVELCHLPIIPQAEQTDEDGERIFASMREQEHFYLRLEPMAGAVEMLNTLWEKYGDKCEILTGVPKPSRGIVTATEDKIDWMKKWFKFDIKVNCVRRSDKKNYCTGPDCILIDDYAKNTDEWQECGGTYILFTDCAQAMEEMKKIEEK